MFPSPTNQPPAGQHKTIVKSYLSAHLKNHRFCCMTTDLILIIPIGFNGTG
jgi:hypothetical protein